MHFIGENWELIKQTIHTEYDLTNISYNTWIEPLQFYDVKDDTVYIQIPTGQAHALNYISNKYSNYFKVTISEMMDHDYDIFIHPRKREGRRYGYRFKVSLF